MRIVLLPSMDYEVFHGRNYLDDEATLFAPTRRLLDRASTLGIPLTLFADVLSVTAHRRAGLGAFVARFERQLVDAVSEGHDVQLHIHAHWEMAERDGDEWRLVEPRITLADYDAAHARDIIADAASYLRMLLRKADTSYRCVAFRAGGLALQPGERALIGMLHDEGISIDSSIAPGLSMSLDTLSIDYTRLPEAANWLISAENGLDGGGDRSLLEIPIATFSLSPLERLGFVLRRLRAFRERRGAGISRAEQQTRWKNLLTLARENLRYLGAKPVFLFSADTKGFTRAMLVNGFRRFVRIQQERGESTLFVSMINHPKLMFPAQENLFFDTLAELRQVFGEQLTFNSYRGVAEGIAEGSVSLSA